MPARRSLTEDPIRISRHMRQPAMAAVLSWFLIAILTLALPSMHAVAGPSKSPQITLTQQEQDWLSAHPLIRLAPDPDFPPIEFIDQAGHYKGIAADYAALIERSLGIRFSIVTLKQWDEVLEAARNREVDLLGAVTPTEKRSEYLAFTHPYLELPTHIITRKEVAGTVTLQQLQGKKVAVVSGYIWQEFLQRDYPGIELEAVPDVASGLSKISAGTADAMIENLAVAGYYIKQLGLTNLRVAGQTEYYGRFAFAIRNDWPELRQILEKALLHIDPDSRSAILSKWITPEHATASTAPVETTPPAEVPPTPEVIKARIEAIERDSQLDPAIRDQALELLRKALTWQDAAHQSEKNAALFASALESAPAETESIRREVSDRIAAGEPPPVPPGATRQELEQRLAQAKADHASAQKARDELADQIKTQQGRPDKIHDQISESKLALDRLQWQQAGASAVATDPLIVEASGIALQAEKDADRAEIHMLEQELLSYDARLALLIAKYNRSQLKLGRRESEERQLQTRLNALFADAAAAAEEAAEQSLREVAGKHPLLQAAAEGNHQLSQHLSNLVVQTRTLSVEQQKIRDLLTEFEGDLHNIEQQLQITTQSPVLAQVLIAERRKLPDPKQYERSAREHRDQIADARLQQFQLTEQESTLAPGDADSRKTLSGEQQLQLQQLTTERDALRAKLTDAYTNLATQLVTISNDEQRLSELLTNLTTLLDERLLWIASTTPIGVAWIEQTVRSAGWFLGRTNWSRATEDFQAATLQAPVLTAGALLLFAILIGIRRQLRRKAAAISENVGNPFHDRFGLTLELLLIKLLWVLPWPLILAGTGWLLQHSHNAEPFSAALGQGLIRLAITVFLVELFRQLSLPRGLAECHLNWTATACKVLHSNLSWVRLFVYPVSFTLGMIELQPAGLIGDAPGRMEFIIGLLGVTLFLWRLMHPRHGAPGSYLQAHRVGWLWQLRTIWYPLLIICPVALLALVLSGYYYSATDLGSRLAYSFYISLGVLLVYHLMLRWARVAEQRLTISRTLEKRDASRQARAVQQSGDASGEGVPDTLELPQTSIQEISAQTRALLGAAALVLLVLALWFQWADLAPAGYLLDQITLWQQMVGTEGKEHLEPVTLWAVTKTIVVLILTIIAVQNFPGFLEISILGRLSLERGSRYAITTITRYLIIALGVIVASNLIGFGWSKLQWMVAALTVGLGFGLQEIFANFVSGLIVLFERPIRIGDTVTVGTTTGTVTRIRTRATTITDRDRKELIIPNKSFVTGDVINWTLSDPVTRLILRVGVAYGSDVELVERLMLDLARAHPLVLDEPPPTVFFSEFGDSALNFELRVFYQDILNKIRLTHELNKAIESCFTEHGIVIPFPQRDIHLRSNDSI